MNVFANYTILIILLFLQVSYVQTFCRSLCYKAPCCFSLRCGRWYIQEEKYSCINFNLYVSSKQIATICAYKHIRCYC